MKYSKLIESHLLWFSLEAYRNNNNELLANSLHSWFKRTPEDAIDVFSSYLGHILQNDLYAGKEWLKLTVKTLI